MKYLSNEEKIVNRLSSDLESMVSANRLGKLSEEDIYIYFRYFLNDAEVDSKITLAVLEQFGDLGKEQARNIKISEGW